MPWIGRIERESALADRVLRIALLAFVPSFIPPLITAPNPNHGHSDPVTTCDGHSYDRAAIEAWLSRGHKRSPMTGSELLTKRLYPNVTLKQLAAHLLPVTEEEAVRNVECEMGMCVSCLVPIAGATDYGVCIPTGRRSGGGNESSGSSSSSGNNNNNRHRMQQRPWV